MRLGWAGLELLVLERSGGLFSCGREEWSKLKEGRRAGTVGGFGSGGGGGPGIAGSRSPWHGSSGTIIRVCAAEEGKGMEEDGEEGDSV
jgi:hypothetical protein